jgi:LysM repeat protein
MDHAARSPLRILAPVSLAAFAVAFLLVVATSDVSEDGGDAARTSAQQRRDLGDSNRERGSRQSAGPAATTTASSAATYTVKTGDTLASISEKTGVSVEKLQELNPQLDPQALVSGQKIKLRE